MKFIACVIAVLAAVMANAAAAAAPQLVGAVAPPAQGARASMRPGWCQKAHTHVEVLICADNELSDLDARMYDIYLKAEIAAPDKKAFAAESRAWLRNVRDVCVDKACLVSAYEYRTAKLREQTSRTPVHMVPGQLVHTKSFDTLACTDKLILLELSDAIAHPGALSDQYFGDLAARGNCSPTNPAVALRILRIERVQVPAGTFAITTAELANASAGALSFYILESALAPEDSAK